MTIFPRYFSSCFRLLVLILLSSFAVKAQRRPASKESLPTLAAGTATYCIAKHDVGNLVLGITNYGKIGIGRSTFRVDCFTGTLIPLGEYPKGSNTTYLYKGGLWIGGIIGDDTLVSTAADVNNETQEWHPVEDMRLRSILDPESPDYEKAVSEQDYLAVYVDTFTRGVPNPTYDPIDNRGHKPLQIEVTQQSYAWSYEHTKDFILLNYEIKNIGDEVVKDLYVGLYWDADVHPGGRDVNLQRPPWGKGVTGGRDDFTGFLYTAPTQFENCQFLDTVAVAWTADNNGDYQYGDFQVGNVIGTCFLDMALDEQKIAYNWWTYNYNSDYDYGPQMRENLRQMGNGLGTPYGDKNKYALLSNGEIDFSQVYTKAIGTANPVWVGPGSKVATLISRGIDVQYVLSIGPFELRPGSSKNIPMAIVAGQAFHVDAFNYNRHLLWDYDPDTYLKTLNFSNLVDNVLTARRVYDIPGVDTNNDGYKGKFRVCVIDSQFVDGQWIPAVAETTYYAGDGIPDWKAAAPPPPPDFWLYPTLNGIRVRFNGAQSETTRDVFSQKIDFEGYRIYIARENRESSYSLIAQYDRKNYDKYVYTRLGRREARFLRMDDPFTLEELRCLYGSGPDPCADSSFDPLRYTQIRPYVHPDFPDSIFYFETHDYNQYEFGVTTPITKIYPNEPRPTSLTDVTPDQLTEDGYLKYYEYECYINDLLPSVPYYVVVTAYDFGSPRTGLAPLESSKTLHAKSAYPDNVLDQQPDEVKNVYVYPNPYRDDAGYRVMGYEGLGQDYRSRDRVRKVTFANLPPKCTIRIFSLDGDLIREIRHDFDPSDPNSSYHEWDLVTRNIQMVVSGLYYWVVEDDQGRVQIGKLVILM
jgi:hypothetical protein